MSIGSNSPPSPSRGLGESAQALGSTHDNPPRAEGSEGPMNETDSTTYREAFADKVRRLGFVGSTLTDECLAKFLGVPRSAIALWKETEPSFSDAIRQAKVK